MDNQKWIKYKYKLFMYFFPFFDDFFKWISAVQCGKKNWGKMKKKINWFSFKLKALLHFELPRNKIRCNEILLGNRKTQLWFLCPSLLTGGTNCLTCSAIDFKLEFLQPILYIRLHTYNILGHNTQSWKNGKNYYMFPLKQSSSLNYWMTAFSANSFGFLFLIFLTT